MYIDGSQFDLKVRKFLSYFLAFARKQGGRLYGLLACRAYSVMIFGALFCTLAVKFFHSCRTNLVKEYFYWIPADIAVLLGIEIVLAVICFCWPRKFVIRAAIIIGTAVLTWSIMNAGWLVRTGTQILPSVLLPLFRNPVDILDMVGTNLIKMPAAAAILLTPGAIAFAFLIFVLARPQPPPHGRRYFSNKIVVSSLFVLIAVTARSAVATRSSTQTVSEEMRYNSQLRAVTSILLPAPAGLRHETNFTAAKRQMPSFEQLGNALKLKPQRPNHNVVIVVLEGIQYKHTSLADERNNLTPYLKTLADQGVEFTNARSSVPHTTKALFALLTGRFPSASQDLAESVPALKPYAGIATVLKQKLNFRTACFESANGSFECWPALAYNLGFDKFWAKEDLDNQHDFVGYFSCDEFSMLQPITEWIQSDERPFCLVIMCSVSHDPYEVPKWFAIPAKEPVERYQQTISYTDKFLASLDAELKRLGLADKTIFCVVGDHGEAFGEHGLFAHERIAYEEVLRVPWVVRAPLLVQPATRINDPVSSVDLTPTLLSLMGFETNDAGFDGVNTLGSVQSDRRIYFSCWMWQGPTGFVQGNRKFVYSPTNKMVSVYDLSNDPLELVRLTLPEQQAQQIANQIIEWRKDTIFQIPQNRTGKIMLFDRWLCTWTGRVSSAHYNNGSNLFASGEIAQYR